MFCRNTSRQHASSSRKLYKLRRCSKLIFLREYFIEIKAIYIYTFGITTLSAEHVNWECKYQSRKYRECSLFRQVLLQVKKHLILPQQGTLTKFLSINSCINSNTRLNYSEINKRKWHSNRLARDRM